MWFRLLAQIKYQGSRDVCSVANQIIRIHHRFDRLKAFHQRLELLGPVFLHAQGQKYELPLRSDVDVHASRNVAKHDLEYLLGFFDGDGCVAAKTKLSSCELSIGQSANHGEALILFFRTFGGRFSANRKREAL